MSSLFFLSVSPVSVSVFFLSTCPMAVVAPLCIVSVSVAFFVTDSERRDFQDSETKEYNKLNNRKILIFLLDVYMSSSAKGQ